MRKIYPDGLYGKALWPEFKGRDGCRTPMPWRKDAVNGGFSVGRPWLPIPAQHLARAVDVEEANADSPLSRCREFTRWRREVPALKTGDITFSSSPAGTLQFSRKDPATGNEILASFNLTGSAVALTVPGGSWKSIPLPYFSSAIKDGKISLGGVCRCVPAEIVNYFGLLFLSCPVAVIL